MLAGTHGFLTRDIFIIFLDPLFGNIQEFEGVLWRGWTAHARDTSQKILHSIIFQQKILSYVSIGENDASWVYDNSRT